MDGLQSPLSGSVRSGFGSVKRYRSRIIIGLSLLTAIPFMFTTFAANVTVGSGALVFGQGSQQAVACDSQVYVAMGEEWHSAPTPVDATAGYFRVKSVTVSNLDLTQCHGARLRLRLLSTTGNEMQIGSIESATVIQATLPNEDVAANVSDPTALQLGYTDSQGNLLSGPISAQVSVNVTGTSIYDGSVLSPSNADVTFYFDPSSQLVNVDAQSVGRTTVETLNQAGSA